jgi:hypothetical protein
MALPKRLRFEVFKRDSFTCQYCGRKAPDVVLHVDHVHPRSQGGSDDLLNLVTSCVECNLGKGPRQLSDASAVEKQRIQLEQLQERKEQIEMMVEWQRSLMGLEQHAAANAADFWSELLEHRFHLTAPGEDQLKELIDRFGLQEVLEAMRIAVRRYVKSTGSGAISQADVETAWSKIGGICHNRKRWSSDPSSEALDRGGFRFVSDYRDRCSHYPSDQQLKKLWALVARHSLGAEPTVQSAYDFAEQLVDECFTEYYEGNHSSYWSAMQAAAEGHSSPAD